MSGMSEVTQEQIREFVAAAHHDLAQVQRLHRANPTLLNSRYAPWNETALEAAAHMGARDIAQYLVAAGAPLTICAAAMLGQTERVAAFLRADPALADATGAHGIPVLVHAALSGQPEIAALLVRAGGGAGVDDALVEAVSFGYTAMVAWLLEYGASAQAVNFEGKSALRIALEKGYDQIVRLLWLHGGGE
jgi:ankyrin repeat protein